MAIFHEKSSCNKDVVCTIPWKHVATKPSGEYRLCCLAQQPESEFVNEHGDVMRLNKDPLHAIRNAQIAKKVRQKMLAGEWHSTCKKCLDEESAGLKSRRLIYLEKESDKNFIQTVKDKTLADGTIKHEDFPLETFDIRIGNLCNLKCRMCDPLYSTKWYTDYQKTTNKNYFYNNGEKVYFSDAEELKKFQWHESDYFWDEILKVSQQIRHIYLIGGEPLIIKNQMEFLRRLVKFGFSENIEIEYNTNLTVLPDEIILLWKQFKKVTIGVSLESIFSENDYIRHPSNFNTIVENMRKIDQHVSENFRVWVSTTFQLLNIFSLPKMIDWVENSNFEFINQFPNSPIVHLHTLHKPLYYNIQCLPEGGKLLAEKKLREKILDLSSKFSLTGYKKYEKMVQKLESIIKFMWGNDLNQNLDQFFDITHQLDVIRKESFQHTFPELAAAIDYSKKDFSVRETNKSF